jgi:stage V sporulation protein G
MNHQQINISDIQIIPINTKNGLVAFASFILNDSLYISSVAVYTRLGTENSYRLVYPSKSVGDKEVNVLYPVKKQVGEYIEQEITKALNNLLKRSDKYVRYSSIDGK